MLPAFFDAAFLVEFVNAFAAAVVISGVGTESLLASVGVMS